jgi:hypothetical protein
MKRLGSENMLVSRASCYREELTFEFRIVPVLEAAMDEAVNLVKTISEPGKILVFTTGVEMCVQLGTRLQKDYKGWVRCNDDVTCVKCDMSDTSCDHV